jgi:hypothetical protein
LTVSQEEFDTCLTCVTVQEEVEAAFDLEDGTVTASDLRADVSYLSGVARPLTNQDLNMTFPSRPLVGPCFVMSGLDGRG